MSYQKRDMHTEESEVMPSEEYMSGAIVTFNSGFQQEWNRCYINLEMSFYDPPCFAWHIDQKVMP